MHAVKNYSQSFEPMSFYYRLEWSFNHYRAVRAISSSILEKFTHLTSHAAKRQKGNYRSDASQLAPGISIVIWWFFVFLHHFRDLETLCRYLQTATKQLKTVKFSKGAVHKRRHQSRGKGGLSKDNLT